MIIVWVIFLLYNIRHADKPIDVVIGGLFITFVCLLVHFMVKYG